MPSFVFVSQSRKDTKGERQTTRKYFYRDYEDYVKHTNFPLWQELHRREIVELAMKQAQKENKIEKALESDTVGKALEEALAEEITKLLKH